MVSGSELASIAPSRSSSRGGRTTTRPSAKRGAATKLWEIREAAPSPTGMGDSIDRRDVPSRAAVANRLSFVGMVVFALLALVMVGRGGSGELAFQFPGGQLEFVTDRSAIPHEELLDSLFTSAVYRPAAEEWLRSRRFFSIQDHHLPDSLSAYLCDPIPEEPIDERLAKASECANKGVARGFVRLREERAVPFHPIGHQVSVGFPSPAPPRGRANACREGPLLGRTVTVLEPQSGRVQVVEVSGYYPCPGVGFPDLQLHRDDARALLRRPLMETEDLLVIW